ncbi:hypothetical protein WUY_01821, partial [Staphylococcus aureus M1062]
RTQIGKRAKERGRAKKKEATFV